MRGFDLARRLVKHRHGLKGAISTSLVAATEHNNTVPSARWAASPTALGDAARSALTEPFNLETAVDR